MSYRILNMYFITVLTAITFLQICGCSEDLPLKSYYYPQDHLVYSYTSNDSFGVEYWKVEPAGINQIKTTIYNGVFDPTQMSIESVYSNGVNLDSLVIFNNGNSASAHIESGFVFPFEAIDSTEVLLYRINWESIDENGVPVTYEIIRNRRFVGFHDMSVLGKMQACAVFRLDERIISDLEGSLEIETTGEEWYAERIGLVYRIRSINPQMKIEQRLLKILTPDEFNAIQ